MQIVDTLIIGAGPAGIAAALQFKRYDMDPLILEKQEIGGLLRNANKVENFPGFPGGISGPELVERMKQQLEIQRIPIQKEEVISVDHSGEMFRVDTTENAYCVKRLIIASGTRSKSPDIIVPLDCRNLIFSEVHSLLNISDKKLAIVGGGDAAFDYALNLAKKNSVLILNRTVRRKCLPLLAQEAEKNEHIKILEGIGIESITRKGDRLQLECNIENSDRGKEITEKVRAGTKENLLGDTGWKPEIEVDYLIFAIGREPELGFVDRNLIDRLDVLVEKGLLYIIGDVGNGIYRQAVIAAGDGIKAAMKAHTYGP